MSFLDWLLSALFPGGSWGDGARQRRARRAASSAPPLTAGRPIDGTFTVSVNGGESDPLPHDASIAAVRAATEQAWARGDERKP